MKAVRTISALVLIAAFGIYLNSCNVVKDISDTLTQLSRLQFKIESVNNFRIAGITLADKKSIGDFSLTDGLKLTNAFSQKKFPAEFTLNLEARNPNDGSGGSKAAGATINSLDYRLIIDDVPTISGDIGSPVSVPGTGTAVTIPLDMGLDLHEYFASEGYNGLMNLALSIGGKQGSSSNIKLDMKPTVKTNIGPITYPSRITVVDKSWTN